MKTDIMALEGLKILDLTRLLPGAFCTQMLADLGAEVIKVELPVTGDYNRAFAPLNKVESGSFLLLNRNKQSITLDLKTEPGKRILLDLVREADVLIEGFRPGVMRRFGLAYETLNEINPRLIYCAISGYGQDGPDHLKAGHDLNYMAEAGALQLFGKAGEGPIVPGLSIADVGGGSLMATTGILAALHARHRTGKGQLVDVSMYDGAIAWLALHAADQLFAGIEPRGGERPFIGQAPCYNVYRCADGKYFALGFIEEHFWVRFCQHLQLDELQHDQWPTGERCQLQQQVLATLFATRPRDAWVETFKNVDLPVGPVLDMAEALNAPHARHRQMLQHIEHPVEGVIPQLGFAVKYSMTPCTLRSPPPLLGEHNDSVLGALGYSAQDIDALRQRQVI